MHGGLANRTCSWCCIVIPSVDKRGLSPARHLLGVAQLEELPLSKWRVAGSSPAAETNARSSTEERPRPKGKAAGSIPAERTILPPVRGLTSRASLPATSPAVASTPGSRVPRTVGSGLAPSSRSACRRATAPMLAERQGDSRTGWTSHRPVAACLAACRRVAQGNPAVGNGGRAIDGNPTPRAPVLLPIPLLLVVLSDSSAKSGGRRASFSP